MMAGIYVHIPFCKTRCVYCGFFSTTSLAQRHAYVDALLCELHDRQSFLQGRTVDTIYLGGGTPSQLPPHELERVLQTIHHIHNVRDGAEVTMEGNPDDLTPDFLRAIRQMGVNRLSMGVQTFSDQRLRFLHRRHTARQATQAVADAQAAGFENISVDLMFGFPQQTLAEWQADVQQALALGVQHLSAYSLMYEEGTPLFHLLETAQVAEVDEEVSVAMYEHLLDATAAAGFQHYELSNFALPGRQSRHNSSYWHGVPYLGVGAGAHSFDGRNRFYHPDSLADYLASAPLVEEHLTDHERYDEFVFTALRTSDGLRLADLRDRFDASAVSYCLSAAQPHLQAGRMTHDGGVLRLTRTGLFVSNDVMSDLMWVD